LRGKIAYDMSENPKNDACKTYLEQTKLLVTLSSAFIIAPAFFTDEIKITNPFPIWMELFFIASVFCGYIVFGTITGTQSKGVFNVYNTGTRIFSLIQIAFFIVGLILLVVSLSREYGSRKSTESKNCVNICPCDTIQAKTIIYKQPK
jgi:hypothetical protein